jgi:hypothetical protein
MKLFNQKGCTVLLLCCAALLGACGVVSPPVRYVPSELESRPPQERVKLIGIYNSQTRQLYARLIMVDDIAIKWALLGKSGNDIVFVEPGTHKYTFEIFYISSRKYPASVTLGNNTRGKAKSIMAGKYTRTVSAKAGELIFFNFRREPDYKSTFDDYYKVTIRPQCDLPPPFPPCGSYSRPG